MADVLKGLFLDPGYTNAMFATGYLDIPGLALVYDELAAFLERPGTSCKLLIGQEPVVRSYQTAEPAVVPMDFPRDYIRRDLAGLTLQPEYEKVVQQHAPVFLGPVLMEHESSSPVFLPYFQGVHLGFEQFVSSYQVFCDFC